MFEFFFFIKESKRFFLFYFGSKFQVDAQYDDYYGDKINCKMSIKFYYKNKNN